jgi:hypothetical protein
MASTRTRRKQICLAMSVLYLLLLLAVGLWYALDENLVLGDKILTTVGVAALPAAAFVAAVVPLLRESRNGVVLVGAAVLAVVAAFFQLMLTFGFALPLSVVLFGVAVADANRAGRLMGISRSRRLIGLGVALALCFVLPAISLGLALVAAAVVLAAGLWKLISFGSGGKGPRCRNSRWAGQDSNLRPWD